MQSHWCCFLLKKFWICLWNTAMQVIGAAKSYFTYTNLNIFIDSLSVPILTLCNIFFHSGLMRYMCVRNFGLHIYQCNINDNAFEDVASKWWPFCLGTIALSMAGCWPITLILYRLRQKLFFIVFCSDSLPITRRLLVQFYMQCLNYLRDIVMKHSQCQHNLWITYCHQLNWPGIMKGL